MRRIIFFSALVTALVVPAAVLGAAQAAGDGTLVVKNGQAPDSGSDKAPVVRLTITGSVIGQMTGQGKIIIDGGVKSNAEVTGAAGPGRDVPQSDTAKSWTVGADGLKFRAVGGTYTIVIYGAGVNLVALGSGTVQLAGMPDGGKDGRYSLNGKDFVSLPGTPTGKLAIGDGSNG
jgi:ABC-type transport system substrate-binding protein